MKYSFGRPTEKDIEYVAKNLRRDNRQELTALCGAGHELDVLQASVKYSELVGCFYIDGVPAAIYGVRSPAVICSVKRVWLLMTDETLKHRLVVGRYTKRYLRAIVAAYGACSNYVDAGNEEILKWLAWLGAKISEPKPYGIYNLPHREFYFDESILKDGD